MNLAETCSLLANIATILGVPTALIMFFREKRKEKLDREYGTYNALDEKYTAFLELHLNWPHLEVYDPEHDNWATLDREDRRRQQLLYQILISILERAFLMYRSQDTEIKRKEYAGWHAYMTDYARSATFRYAWRELKLGEQFQEDFVKEMDALLAASQP